jgi:hypothetical protein
MELVEKYRQRKYNDDIEYLNYLGGILFSPPPFPSPTYFASRHSRFIREVEHEH